MHAFLRRASIAMVVVVAALVNCGPAEPAAAPVPQASTPACVAGAALLPTIREAELPPEARLVLRLARARSREALSSHDAAVVVFENREHRLPEKPRGWYREYTVRTP